MEQFHNQHFEIEYKGRSRVVKRRNSVKRVAQHEPTSSPRVVNIHHFDRVMYHSGQEGTENQFNLAVQTHSAIYGVTQ